MTRLLGLLLGCTPDPVVKGVDGGLDTSAQPDSGGVVLELPQDDDPLDDPRRDVDTGLVTGGEGGVEDPVLFLRHGGFAWTDMGVLMGHVRVTTMELTCEEMFATGADPGEGVHVDIQPPRDEEGAPIWTGVYPLCGEPPCIRTGFVRFGDESLPPPDDLTVTVTRADDREVHLAVSASSLLDAEVEMWNCGDLEPWRE